jgi:hypothetical protein
MSYGFDDSDPDTEPLYDALGSPVGAIGRGSSGRFEARDYLGNLLGSYEEGSGLSFDSNGITVGRGNWMPAMFGRPRR